MEENYLTEGTFKASIDSLIDSKFGEGYTLQDVGELVELTEMTLEDRMELMTKAIDKDFEDMSKSLDNLQKSLYDMLDMLTDSQVDLKESAEHGGITDADIQKIVDGLKLEEKFFPHLYQYLDERFGLNEEKIKNFRSRTEKVIDADLGEVPVGDEREGRTESTAKINRELDKDRDKKAGKKAFEDQAVFSSRLKLWTEGHKEPSKQGDDKEDKKDKKKDDESLLSKIVKIGMIAGMIVEILKNSPELVNTIKDIFTGENGLFPRLQKVLDDLKLGDKIASAFQGVKEWFKETFADAINMISKIYSVVEGIYYGMMSSEEQKAYAEANPDSDLAMWIKGGGGDLDLWDTAQFTRLMSGKSGEFLKELNQSGKMDRLVQEHGDIETLASIQGGSFSAYNLYYLDEVLGHLTAKERADLLSTIAFPDKLSIVDASMLDTDFMQSLMRHGAENTWVASENRRYLTNVKAAISAMIASLQSSDETRKLNEKVQQNVNESIAKEAEVRRASEPAKPTYLVQQDNRSAFAVQYDAIMDDNTLTEQQKTGKIAKLEQEQQFQENYGSPRVSLPTQGFFPQGFFPQGDYVDPKYKGTVVQIHKYTTINKSNVGNGESRYHTTN